MSRVAWIEGLILVAIGILSLVESIRLIIYKNPQVIYDVIGPGYYLLILSICLLVTTAIHIYHNLGGGQPVPKEEKTSKEMWIRLIGACAACAIYAILISIIGYGTASFVFFVIIFRIVGIRSWPFIFIISVLFATAYYFIFVKFANMIFPRGILF